MPVNMNLSKVLIRKFNQEETQTSKYFKEPSSPGGKAYSDPIEVDAQVCMFSLSKKVYLKTGDNIESDGYLLLDTEEMINQGLEFKKGDIIVKIGRRVVDLKITEVNEDSYLETMGNDAESTLTELMFINNKQKVGGVY